MPTFGEFARDLRRRKKLGLRQAARAMDVSPAYLSQVERDIDDPSLRLLGSMKTLYECPVWKLQEIAELSGVQRRERKPSTRSVDELRALYRLGAMFTTDEVEEMMRHVLKQRGMSDEDVESELAKIRAELPRIRNAAGEGLFASDMKPRVLPKRVVTQMAYAVLQRNGLDAKTYAPPTPVETIVENEEGISYLIDRLPSSNGDPIVLGRTRWCGGQREITISKDLAESGRDCDGHRFRFTLAHELFHALEHLPRAAAGSQAALARVSIFDVGLVDRAPHRLSRAERAVDRWATTQRARTLSTREDWREWQANAFASALLMPEWAVRESFEARMDSDLVRPSHEESARELALRVAGEGLFLGRAQACTLAQQFDVSRQAMAIRLLDLGLVEEA